MSAGDGDADCISGFLALRLKGEHNWYVTDENSRTIPVDRLFRQPENGFKTVPRRVPPSAG
jgi:hypothetical protein